MPKFIILAKTSQISYRKIGSVIRRDLNDAKNFVNRNLGYWKRGRRYDEILIVPENTKL